MANNFKIASVIAKKAVDILENEPGILNAVYRDYEGEYQNTVNGYKKGATITIRKPTDFTVTDGATMDLQDISEGSTSLVVDQRKHVAFQITAQDMTLSMSMLEERVIKPAVIQLKSKVEQDIFALYKQVPNWVGTPGQTINSFTDFAKGPERLDELGVPQDGRYAFLSPGDHWGLVGSQTALYVNSIANPAYRNGSLGMIGGVDTYMSQTIQSHTVGAAADTTAVADAAAGSGVLSTTWDTVKDLGYMWLSTDGWDASTLKAGDVITLDNIYDVNPVTKATLPHLKMFVVLDDVVTAAGDTAIKISPPIITSGAQQTVSTVPVDGTTGVNKIGTGGSVYRQNMVFHKNAFALATVPIEIMPGSVDGYRATKGGISIKVQPVYDGVNDVGKWRMDILYGVKCIDPRLAVRLSGTS